MMRRASFVVGVAALSLVGPALPAHAGGKRLPKAKALVESIRPASTQSHYVRTEPGKPTAARSSALDVDREYNPSHFIREGAPR
jgi:hypothetical protein